METNEKTRLLIGSLAVAVVLVIGYGLYQTLGQPDLPIAPSSASVQTAATAPQPAASPAQVPMQIHSETSVVANSGGHSASVTGEPGLDYEWSIKGGTIEGDPHGSNITWTAGNDKEVSLFCKGTTRGKESTAQFRVVVKQPPAISRFEVFPEILTEGSTAKLSWDAANTDKLILNPGGQDVSAYSGPALEMKPLETTTYTLTATNSTGVEIKRELTLKVVPKPEIKSLRSEPVAESYKILTVIGEFKGTKAELKFGNTVIATSETSPLQVDVEGLKNGSVLVFTVSNEAGTYASSSLTFSTKTPEAAAPK